MKIRIFGNIVLLFSLLFIRCNPSYDKEAYNRLAVNPGYKKAFKQEVTLTLTDTLNILTQDKPIYYKLNDIYKDTLFFGARGIAKKERNLIDIYNLKKKLFSHTVQYPEFEFPMAFDDFTVYNPDSIFLVFSNPPEIKIVDTKGNVNKKIKFGPVDLSIKNKKIKKNNSYSLSFLFNKPQIARNRLYVKIDPNGLGEIEGLREAKRILMYDLHDDQLIKAICPEKGPMALKGVFYLYQLMTPYYIVARDTLFISYPLDHYVYLYDLDGKFLEKKLVSASQFKKLPDPIPKSKLTDNEYIRRWWIPAPFYGPFYYHPKVQLFTRIFYQKQPLRMANGKINDGSKRTAYVLIFDENLRKVGEVKFTNGQLGVYKVLPLSDGILVAPNRKYWTNENEFVFKYVYKFKKIH